MSWQDKWGHRENLTRCSKCKSLVTSLPMQSNYGWNQGQKILPAVFNAINTCGTFNISIAVLMVLVKSSKVVHWSEKPLPNLPVWPLLRGQHHPLPRVLCISTRWPFLSSANDDKIYFVLMPGCHVTLVWSTHKPKNTNGKTYENSHYKE
jgi:hypothetical protein